MAWENRKNRLGLSERARTDWAYMLYGTCAGFTFAGVFELQVPGIVVFCIGAPLMLYSYLRHIAPRERRN